MLVRRESTSSGQSISSSVLGGGGAADCAVRPRDRKPAEEVFADPLDASLMLDDDRCDDCCERDES